MIEEIVLTHLSQTLTVPVYMEIPENPPGSFILLEKTGSGKSNHVCTSTFAVQSYAESMLAAAELNELAKSVMETLDENDEIAACRLNTDYAFSDTANKRHRYQAVFDITHY